MTPDTVVKLLNELARNAPVGSQRQFFQDAAGCVAELMPSPAADTSTGEKITDLHCWVATFRDGREGIIAGSLPGLFGMTTLMSSHRRTAEALGVHARDVVGMERDGVVGVRLVTFTSTEGTRQ